MFAVCDICKRTIYSGDMYIVKFFWMISPTHPTGEKHICLDCLNRISRYVKGE